jgi:hypothetical protein
MVTITLEVGRVAIVLAHVDVPAHAVAKIEHVLWGDKLRETREKTLGTSSEVSGDQLDQDIDDQSPVTWYPEGLIRLDSLPSPKTTGSRGLSPRNPVPDSGANKICGTTFGAALVELGYQSFFAFAIRLVTKLSAVVGLWTDRFVQSIFRLPAIALRATR